MFVRAIGNLYNINRSHAAKSTVTVPYRGQGLKPLTADIVSFSGKNYDKDDILNPTGHCAYCGSKVYDEQQIDSIAQEMLALKSDRLEGKIKSVLEKLTGAKHAPDLAIAKQTENKDSIAFFESFAEAGRKKPYARGEDILSEEYGKDYDEALEYLKRNMQPLLATVDHILPQRLRNENDNVDVNLVEACFCCNHDIKDGNNFSEFYKMFPSVQYNMPQDKFRYAKAMLLDNPEDGISQRLSASTIMKHIELLFTQKRETENELSTIKRKLSDWNGSIDRTIAEYQGEIKQKEGEIEILRLKFSERKNDEEFASFLRRAELREKISQLETANLNFRDMSISLSTKLNDMKYETVKKGKKSERVEKVLTESELAKANEMLEKIKSITAKIQENNEIRMQCEIEAEELEERFPSYETYKERKSEADAVLRAYGGMENEYVTSEKLTETLTEIKSRINEIENAILKIQIQEFSPEKYSEEQQNILKEYKSLAEALKYIDGHTGGGSTKALINLHAQTSMEKRFAELSDEQIIRDMKEYEENCNLNKELAKIKTKETETIRLLDKSEASARSFESVCQKMTAEDAKKQSEEAEIAMKRVQEKESDIEIPKRIESLKASISLLESTVQELRNKQKQIVEMQ